MNTAQTYTIMRAMMTQQYYIYGAYDTNDDKSHILREEEEAAVKYLKGGKSPGNDNIPAELIKNRGEAMISALTIICNKIWETGEWPTPLTKSMIITLPNCPMGDHETI